MDPAIGTPKSVRDPDEMQCEGYGTERKNFGNQVGEKTWGFLGCQWEGVIERRVRKA